MRTSIFDRPLTRPSGTLSLKGRGATWHNPAFLPSPLEGEGGAQRRVRGSVSLPAPIENQK